MHPWAISHRTWESQYTSKAHPPCEMHHIRNPNDVDFIYDPRTQPLEDPVLRSRCELATFSDAAKKEHAVFLL